MARTGSQGKGVSVQTGVSQGYVGQTMPLRVLNKSPAKHMENSLTNNKISLYEAPTMMWVCLLLLLCGVFSRRSSLCNKVKKEKKEDIRELPYTLTSLKTQTIEYYSEFSGLVFVGNMLNLYLIS